MIKLWIEVTSIFLQPLPLLASAAISGHRSSCKQSDPGTLNCATERGTTEWLNFCPSNKTCRRKIYSPLKKINFRIGWFFQADFTLFHSDRQNLAKLKQPTIYITGVQLLACVGLHWAKRNCLGRRMKIYNIVKVHKLCNNVKSSQSCGAAGLLAVQGHTWLAACTLDTPDLHQAHTQNY